MLTINSPLFNYPKPTTTNNTSSQKLASGVRINSAKDDAAGLQISNRLTTQTLVKQQTLRNLNDGISYGQVADAALGELTEALQRMRTLAIQSANGVNTVKDREALDREVVQLIAHIDGIAQNTEIFGKKPLLSRSEEETNLNNVPTLDEILTNGVNKPSESSGYRSYGVIPTGSKNVRIQIDSFGMNDDINLFTQSGQHLLGQDLTASLAQVESQLFTPENGFNGGETYDNSLLFDGGGFNYPATNSNTILGMTFTYSGNGNPGNNLEEVIIDTVTEPLLLTVIGTGFFSVTATWDSIGQLNGSGGLVDNDGPFMVTSKDLAVGKQGYITYEDINASSSALGIQNLSVATVASSQSAISTLDSALARISSFRAEVGAKMNGIAAVARSQSKQSELLSAANQRIKGSNFAKEISAKIRSDIRRDAGIAVATQANRVVKEGIFGLLQSLS